MARLFNGSVGSDVQASSAPSLPTAPPLTLACWFKRTASGNNGYTLTVSDGNGAASVDVFALNASTNQVLAQAYNVALNGVATASQTSDTDWHLLIGEFASATSRTARIDGTTGSADTTNVNPTGITQINVAVLNEAFGSYFSGSVCRAAGWAATLTDGEKDVLQRGFSPRRIRPQSLRFYIPLVRDVQELMARATFGTTGGSVTDHPRTYGL